jgi:nucleotide-binding universal stress UspA family protein
VADGILAVASELENSVVCMASHARGRLGGVVLGSFASELLASTHEPVVLVGPAHDAERKPGDGPIVACIDGSAISESVLPVAARWASALGCGLRIVTVIEPSVAGLDDRPVHRRHGPDGDAQAYVDALADAWPDLDASGVVVNDPIGAADGLASFAQESPCGMLAVTTHARQGLRRAVFGSQATSILRHSPVAVLAVPPAHP